MTETLTADNKLWRVWYISVLNQRKVQWGETPFENEARSWLSKVRALYAGQESWAEEVTQTETVKRLDW